MSLPECGLILTMIYVHYYYGGIFIIHFTSSWQTFDVRKEPGKHLAEIVYELKPWTQYAMYVQTDTLSSTTQGGISDIIYFTTQPTGKNV